MYNDVVVSFSVCWGGGSIIPSRNDFAACQGAAAHSLGGVALSLGEVSKLTHSISKLRFSPLSRQSSESHRLTDPVTDHSTPRSLTGKSGDL